MQRQANFRTRMACGLPIFCALQRNLRARQARSHLLNDFGLMFFKAQPERQTQQPVRHIESHRQAIRCAPIALPGRGAVQRHIVKNRVDILLLEVIDQAACVYRTASGGGATIVDKFTARKVNRQETKSEAKPGQRRAAACERLPS